MKPQLLGMIVACWVSVWALADEARDAQIRKLIGQLKDKDASIRATAADILGRTGPEAKSAVPALIDLLKDKDAKVRAAAAESLGGIGPDAKSAVPELIKLLKDKDASVRAYAASGLEPIRITENCR